MAKPLALSKQKGKAPPYQVLKSNKYKHGLPAQLPAWFRPLPFCYQSTGIETCFTTGKKPEDLITEFRASYYPRIAVTVDMIATGTDIKPLEVVMFMRSVKSRGFFEQMKGRGVRVIGDDDLKAVTSDARTKDHFVIVDAVGVCEQDKTDSRPMDRKKYVSFEKLLQAVRLGNTETDVISSLAVRLARLNQRLSNADHTRIVQAAKGKSLKARFVGEVLVEINRR